MLESNEDHPFGDPEPVGRSPIAKRWRLGLVGFGILLLLILALLIYMSLQGFGAGYMPDSSPEASAYNYSLALINEDYTRAWRYLSTSLTGYPQSPEILRNQLFLEGQQFDLAASPCIYVDSTVGTGDRVTVRLREQYYDPCGVLDLQNLTYTYFQVELVLEAGEWRILHADRHFIPGWSSPQ